jgi:hypothetical protein
MKISEMLALKLSIEGLCYKFTFRHVKEKDFQFFFMDSIRTHRKNDITDFLDSCDALHKSSIGAYHLHHR